MNSRPLALDAPAIAWAFLFVGILAAAYAWRNRHPDTTADFTLFYVSAQQTSERMFEQPPGPPRGNMNPPLFQLMMRPLTAFSLPTAAAIFRALNLVTLAVCIWWIVRTSEERWTAADYGALLAWAPMASMISLNQLTWLLWPPLLWAWWCWRQERWTAGAIGYGFVLSLKPFLGVILLWLIVARRWRAAITSMAAAAASFAIGLAAYGIDVSRAWVDALGAVSWAHAGMNASLEGFLTRALSKPTQISDPIVFAPALVSPLAMVGGAAIVVLTLFRTRGVSIDQAWPSLIMSALLASPLGWLYYIWWILPGTRPAQLLLEAPLLWIPMTAFLLGLSPSAWLPLTLGSIYFWGLFGLWLNRMCFDLDPVAQPEQAVRRSSAMRLAFVAVIVAAFVVARGQYVIARQMVEDDAVLGTWVLDRGASTFSPDLDIESRTTTFAATEDRIQQTMMTEIAGRKPERIAYTARYNGKDHPIQGSFLKLVALRRIDDRTVERRGKVGTDVVEIETRTLSADGRTLTVVTKGTRDGTAYSSVQRFNRLDHPRP